MAHTMSWLSTFPDVEEDAPKREFDGWNPFFGSTTQTYWDVPDEMIRAHTHELDHDAQSDDSSSCEVCGRLFSRHCDKNKHVKAHTREFKCPIDTCKYHTHGFPTQKESDRHFNDKHASSPPIYSCEFQPCPYQSKRSSNCKQHMGKAHGWTYERSRKSNHNCHPSVQGDNDSIANNNIADETEYQMLTGPPGLQPLPDSIWYSGSGFVNDDETALLETGSQGANLCISWIPEHSEAYNVKPLPPYDACGEFHTDPNLTNAVPFGQEALTKSLTPPQTPARPSQDVHESNTIQCQQFTIKVEPPSPQREPVTSQGTCGTQGTHSRHSGKRDRSEKPFSTPAPDDEDDHDDERPSKRLKSSPEFDLDDMQMPCPFRLAHPAVYNRDLSEKYSTCHTKHENISTIVRHLGRSAHRFQVDDRSISSFDIETTDGVGRRAAGLCKKCWKAFTDRNLFNSHLRQACTNASRSKKEKYRLLIDTFCSLVDNEENSLSSPSPSHFSDPAAPPRREAIGLTPPAEEMVRMSEYIRLRKRLDDLEKFTKELAQMVQIFRSVSDLKAPGTDEAPQSGDDTSPADSGYGTIS